MKSLKMVLSIAGYFIIPSMSAYAADIDREIQGTWQGKYAESCKAVREGATEDFIIIRQKGIERYEGSCAVTQASKKNGESLIKAICESEGETNLIKMRVRLTDKNHIVVDGKYKYARCK